MCGGKLSGRDLGYEAATPMGKNGNAVWVKMGRWDVVWTKDHVTVFQGHGGIVAPSWVDGMFGSMASNIVGLFSS